MTTEKRTKRGTVAALLILAALLITAALTTTADSVQQSIWSLLPPFVAISLALVTKEVYSALFAGIVSGGLLYSGFALEGTINHVYSEGIVAVLSDAYNVGILIFLVILGIIVALMNRSGGSAAFGRWAQTRIKNRIAAQLATIGLGVIIFIDDYFNCLTVGGVMRPVADKFQISRAKLAYLQARLSHRRHSSACLHPCADLVLGSGGEWLCAWRNKRHRAVYPVHPVQFLRRFSHSSSWLRSPC